MTSTLHALRFRFGAAACCLWLAGCAAPGPQPNTAPEFRDQRMTLQQADSSIEAGRSTRADVTAALGAANVVRFDSGYEVWVYRSRAAGTALADAEFVILFGPDGIVRKTRTRPAYAKRDA